MKILADENIDRAIVAWLREQGHDVLWVCSDLAQADDEELLAVARRESRIVLTGDLDFGELIYRQALDCSGIILLRLPPASQAERLSLLRAHWESIATRAPGHFIVVMPEKMRVRPL